MQPVKCIIVDDEPAAHYVLSNYIGQNAQLELVFEAYNGQDAIDYLKENSVHLMFLDIHMPDISGLELLKQIQNPPATILTTAYSEFALESYEYRVVDYLLKPIYYPRFLKALNRFFETNQNAEDEEEFCSELIVKVDSHNVNIPLDSILYTQSYGNYVKIVTQKRNYIATITTAELEKKLPSEMFIRAHKSYIIAIGKVEDMKKDRIIIKRTYIPIGITYKREISERLRDSD
ncbi:LytTR family DNA-binding domain-containing protein [Marinilongibacter aquaticus]|uniref:LytR/AlgR family response regulator transcription factor n=1 Tax=Marinilongibacter aquaticus TaxID=2975157 RepID=UPI0021BD217A|nr:LytTR family DNA-binding domain-containing protein [Marinilongibacter aquaticus]UBM59400.1 LytTR family DNA-binding domain-containing protein [Marinilongibacter aquaticus]